MKKVFRDSLDAKAAFETMMKECEATIVQMTELLTKEAQNSNSQDSSAVWDTISEIHEKVDSLQESIQANSAKLQRSCRAMKEQMGIIMGRIKKLEATVQGAMQMDENQITTTADGPKGLDGQENNKSKITGNEKLHWIMLCHENTTALEDQRKINEEILARLERIEDKQRVAEDAIGIFKDQRRNLEKDWKKEISEGLRKLFEELRESLEWREDKGMILMVRDGEGSTKELLILDRETSQWKASPVKLPGSVRGCGMIGLAGWIYIFGGGLGDKTFKLNKKMKWVRVADLNEGRNNISNSFLVFDGCIWVFGGKNQSDGDLNSVEKYNPRKNKWIQMPPMKQKRKCAVAAVCGGKIYVCGGNFDDGDSFEALKSVECFDPKEEVWTNFVDLPTPAYGMGVISDGDCLIICGGADGKTELKTVWKINLNDANPEWKELPSMKEERYFLTVQPFGKKIFAIGGHGKKSVEIFDGTSWEYGPELPEICWGVPSVVIFFVVFSVAPS